MKQFALFQPYFPSNTENTVLGGFDHDSDNHKFHCFTKTDLKLDISVKTLLILSFNFKYFTLVFVDLPS